jgi:hypothetical protein
MKLRGQGVGTGAVLGAAAVVRTRNGVALMPSVPPNIAELQASRQLLGKPDVILAAEHYSVALSIAETLEWANVVGIASADDPAPPAGAVPAVVGIANLLPSLPEDALLLLDAERGVVSVNPDFTELAQFQAEAENINPRKRFFLDAQHEPTQTEDGRPFPVFRNVLEERDLTDSVHEGAEGLRFSGFYFTDENNLPRDAFGRMARLAQEAGGKPVFVDDDFGLLPAEVVVAGAAHCELTVAINPFREGASDPAETLRQWHAAADARIERGDEARIPHLALLLKADFWETDTLAERLESFANQGVSRLVLDLNIFGLFDDAALAKLDALVQAAAPFLLPLYVEIELAFRLFGTPLPTEDYAELVRLLLGVGAAGIITEEATAEFKEIIRGLNYDAARAEVFSRLAQLPEHSPADDAV